MRKPQIPSGLSAFELQGRLLHISPNQRSQVRWRGAELAVLTADTITHTQLLLTQLQGFSDLFLGTSSSPWAGATLPTGAAAQQAIDIARRLAYQSWPALLESASRMTKVLTLPDTSDIGELSSLLGLLNGIDGTLKFFQSAVFQSDLKALYTALAPSEVRISAILAWCFNPAYRKARQAVRALCTAGERSSSKLRAKIKMALAQLDHWNVLSPGRLPVTCDEATACRSALDQVLTDLNILNRVLTASTLRTQSIGQLDRLITQLAADTVTPFRLPSLLEIENKLISIGLEPVLKEIKQRQLPSNVWSKFAEHAWLASCLDQAKAENTKLAGFDGSTHQQICDRFRKLERIESSCQSIVFTMRIAIMRGKQ